MLPYDFARLQDTPDQEALCHAVFDEANTKWQFEGRHAINAEQVTVICVETFFGEVLNGGFDQYLWNSSGRLASFGPAALRGWVCQSTGIFLSKCWPAARIHPR